MVTLREEYSRQKAEKNKAINEAAIQWVLENVLLLNETFNREALQRLQSSITKFDSTFAPFAAKVPEVKASLDDATELMNRITMGEKVTRSDGRLRLTDEEKESIKEPATYMVRYLSILYNNLSRFFNKDMKVMLGFPIFRKAMENPMTPLKDLAEANRMKRAMLHALVPSSEAQAILQRMYRSMDLPSLNYKQIAEELMNLSVNDFKDLTHVDKVPLVVSQEKSKAPAESVAPMEAATGTNPKAPPPLEEDLLAEAGGLEQAGAMAGEIGRLIAILGQLPQLGGTKAAADNVRKQLLRMAANPADKALQKQGKDILATAQSVQKYFGDLGTLWPQVKNLMPEAGQNLEPEEMQNILAILNNNTKKQASLWQQLKSMWGAAAAQPLFPALQPEAMNAELINFLQNQKGPQDVKQFEDFFTALGNAKLGIKTAGAAQVAGADSPAGASAPGQGSQTPGGATASTPATGAAGAAGATPSGTTAQRTLTGVGGPAAGAGAPADPAGLAAKMGPVMGLAPNDPNLAGQLKKLVDAGWKITPP